MSQTKSAVFYMRLKTVRGDLRELPDMTETAYPRYQQNHTLTHRRGENRMSKWLKYR
jgi:hypothetical protein